jgi:RNA ligase (TIGR02306 family)
MGLLTEAPSLAVLGADVADLLRITKWEQASPTHEDDADPPPVHVPVYTDIEGLRRWPDIFRPGEEVIITEKLHGESLRAVLVGDQLHVSSRIRWKIRGGKGNFWRAAEAVKLQEQLGHRFAVYGESHGSVGGFPYGARGGAPLRLFDAWDLAEQRYLDYDEFLAMSFRPDMMAPMLYRGPWDPAAAALLAEGPSTLDPSHVREGIVVRPVHERWDERIGRVILKLHGEGFLLKA